MFQALLKRVKPVEVDSGLSDGVTTAEAQRVKDLKRGCEELRRFNRILKLASTFLRRPSHSADGRPKGCSGLIKKDSPIGC